MEIINFKECTELTVEQQLVIYRTMLQELNKWHRSKKTVKYYYCWILAIIYKYVVTLENIDKYTIYYIQHDILHKLTILKDIAIKHPEYVYINTWFHKYDYISRHTVLLRAIKQCKQLLNK